MKNTWIIGDIHGEISLLEKLLEHIARFEPEQLVFVGDYIDRGPGVKAVIDRVMGLDGDVVCLMGNHELMMLNAMEDMGYGYSPVELWYYNGAEATLQSFGFTSFFSFQSDMEHSYLEFFRSLRMSHTLELPGDIKVLITHAGVSPAIPVADLKLIENYADLNRYMLERHIPPADSFLWVREDFYEQDPAGWEGYLVVHGHTPVMALQQSMTQEGLKQFRFMENDLAIRWNGTQIASIDIDSGSCYTGRLSGLGFIVENGEEGNARVRMRSLTVSLEDLFPRDLGWVPEPAGKH
jgi:serine/threonine protein phosphatase 1